MLKFGKFLPRANAEVVYLDAANKKKYEERDDVAYVELGEGGTLHCMLVFLKVSVKFSPYSYYCPIIMSHFILRPILSYRPKGVSDERRDSLWNRKSPGITGI